MNNQKNEHQRYLRSKRKLWNQHMTFKKKLSAGEPITAEDRQGEQEYIEDCYRDNLKRDLQIIRDELSRVLETTANPRGYSLNKAAYYLTLEDLQELKTIADNIYVYAHTLYCCIEEQETEHINRAGGRE